MKIHKLSCKENASLISLKIQRIQKSLKDFSKDLLSSAACTGTVEINNKLAKGQKKKKSQKISRERRRSSSS